MTPDFSDALMAREKAAADLMLACHALTQALETFSRASGDVLQQIPPIAVSVGERAKERRAASFAGDPSDGPAEDNQRKHSAHSAGLGARAAIEHQMCQALDNGFRGGRAEEAIGVEFSTEAGIFLRPAIEIAATRPAQTAPDNGFAAIVTAQCNRLRELAQQLT